MEVGQGETRDIIMAFGLDAGVVGVGLALALHWHWH